MPEPLQISDTKRSPADIAGARWWVDNNLGFDTPERHELLAALDELEQARLELSAQADEIRTLELEAERWRDKERVESGWWKP